MSHRPANFSWSQSRRAGGAGCALRSEATMPVLWRSCGRRRDPQACHPGTRAASPAPASRDGGAVTRHGQPQSSVEALPLRRSDGRASRSSESYPATLIAPQPHIARHGTARPTPLKPIHAHRCHAIAAGRQGRATSVPAPESSKPHSAALVARGFVHGRLSDAGPALAARPALAGVRNPSPSRSFRHPDGRHRPSSACHDCFVSRFERSGPDAAWHQPGKWQATT